MSDNPYNQKLLQYLEKKSPEEWHQVAWNWNWDNGIEPLQWIIKQPECNKGTALLIYWYAGPKWLYQSDSRETVKAYERPKYDLIKEIEEKYLAGFYQNDHIYFDPQKDFDSHDWTKEYDEVIAQQPIPSAMFKPTAGQKLDRRNLAEDYPPEVL